MLTPFKITEIFVQVDDFCKEFELEIIQHKLNAGNCKARNRKASLADSEITLFFKQQIILVFFTIGSFFTAINLPL